MNNQPAFPTARVTINGVDDLDGVSCYGPGITMLDYFAAKALQGALASGLNPIWHICHADRAEFAYYQAEAMLEERAKRGL
jgi:hypothetical protein